MNLPTTKHFLSLFDLEDRDTLRRLLLRAIELKRLRKASPQKQPQPLLGKSVALIFEKPSTRTRISFEVGVQELGGNALPLMKNDLQLGRGEPLEDTARMLTRFVHGVVLRTSAHSRLEELRKYAEVPIINGLSDRTHPCQLLADLQTMIENFSEDLTSLKVAWIGDGNNVAHSWINAASLMGFELVLACPKGYEPDASVVAEARSKEGKISLSQSPRDAVAGAHVLVTDVWTSMGQEEENAKRLQAFQGYGVDNKLLGLATKEAIFLHCLPAHRGEEVSKEVLEGAQSRVWDEAENRLHAQKALLEYLLT